MQTNNLLTLQVVRFVMNLKRFLQFITCNIKLITNFLKHLCIAQSKQSDKLILLIASILPSEINRTRVTKSKENVSLPLNIPRLMNNATEDVF